MPERHRLTVVCWLWKQDGRPGAYNAGHVNTLASMVDRHLAMPHRIVCVTDRPDGIDGGIDIVPLWDSPVKLPNGKLNCYRRLRAFSDEAREWFGERFVSIDLDCVVTGPLDPLFDRPDDFVIWGDTAPRTLYNGSLWLMTAGSRRHVWETFDPADSPRQVAHQRLIGSDQAWMSIALGPGEARWAEKDGVWSYRNQIHRTNRGLPAGARIVFFHGHIKPWSAEAQMGCAWVREHYR